MQSKTYANEVAKKYPYLGRCHRCTMPTGGRRPEDEPFLCGQCRSEIHEEAGRKAVEDYLEAAAQC